MLSIAAFGVPCEIGEADHVSVVQDHLRLPRQEAEALLEAERSKFEERLRAAEPGSVVFGPAPASDSRRSRASRSRASVEFNEFADLSDGRRVTVRSDRGWSWSCNHSLGAWYGQTRTNFTKQVRDYFEAEAEDCCPITPEWVVERLQRLHGVEVDPASVDAALQLPLQVEFGPAFTSNSRNRPDEVLDALYEAGCTDASIGHRTVEFDREAPTRWDAIQSAIQDVTTVAGVRVVDVRDSMDALLGDEAEHVLT